MRRRRNEEEQVKRIHFSRENDQFCEGVECGGERASTWVQFG